MNSNNWGSSNGVATDAKLLDFYDEDNSQSVFSFGWDTTQDGGIGGMNVSALTGGGSWVTVLTGGYIGESNEAWHNIVFRWAGVGTGNFDWYVDGSTHVSTGYLDSIADDNTTTPIAGSFTSSGMRVGILGNGYDLGTMYSEAGITDLRIYSDLTNQNITDLYRAGAGDF
jgi:hypothetical protein